MAVDRRTVLKLLPLAPAAAAATPARAALPPGAAPPHAVGMLYDATRCIGCRACMVACKEANDLPAEPGPLADGLWDAPLSLDASTKTIIKLARDGDERSFVKAQCMHCLDPACASACMLRAMHKNPDTGVVEYDARWCVGCRYCQMACAFNVPKFEFGKVAPKIVKCELCRHRVRDAAARGADGFTRYPAGQGPACCEVCPRGAIVYGRRDELLDEAHRRIREHPGRYVEDRVYGETEAGGTQVLYLSHLPFAQLGLPALGPDGVPDLARTVQASIYHGFVAPIALYVALAAVLVRNRRRGGGDDAGDEP
jgi:Fe-S-cluster-containing dehydrogenase component